MKELSSKIFDSDPRSISRALSMVENKEKGYLDLLDELYKKGDSAKVLGFTGAPGVGKSTLVDAYASELIKNKKRVAVIAVDPSSPFSGGAILGDRIRMNSSDDNIFIRSVASRGAIGGVSDAVFNMIVVFRAAGFEYIVVETVGVGQNEVSISKLTDLTFLVMSPGAGDDIQMMKAGIMEVGDIFIVNKSDISGSDELIAFMKASLGDIANRIIKTSAKDHTGIKELYELIDSTYLKDSKTIKEKSKSILKEGLRYLIMSEVNRRVDKLINQADIKLDDIVEGSKSPYSEMKRILKGGLLKW